MKKFPQISKRTLFTHKTTNTNGPTALSYTPSSLLIQPPNLEPKATYSTLIPSPAPMSSSESARRRITHRRNRSLTPHKLSDLSLEPLDNVLHTASSEYLIHDFDCQISVPDGCLYRSVTCSDDVISLAPPLLSPRTLPEDSRVVVSITVEGSPGPIRTMVKLNTTVEETIKLVIHEYAMEGRSPPLDTHSASHYELHLSYFSLESLDRSSTIGNVGSRTFYLRRSVVEVDRVDDVVRRSHQWRPSLMVLIPGYIFRNIVKSLRRMCCFWRILGCLHYDDS